MRSNPGFFRMFRLDGLRLRGLLFAPRKPRHPLLRTAIGVLGLAVLLVLVVIGVFVGTAMVGFGVGTWAHHPGAGIAAAGLVIVVVAVLIGFQV